MWSEFFRFNLSPSPEYTEKRKAGWENGAMPLRLGLSPFPKYVDRRRTEWKMRLKGRQKSRKRRFRRMCFLLALALVGLLLAVDASLRPTVTAAAESQANLYATRAIQETVYREVERLEMEYGDLVRLTYGDQGTVTSLQTDMLAMSKLQSAVTSSVIDSILQLSSHELTLPVGTLTGNPFLSGRGPEVEVRLIPAGFVETRLKNVFDGAGINQTRHQILLNVRLEYQAVLPGYAIGSQVDTDIVLAETVIVGLVPGAYTLVSDGTDPLVGLIQDYGAGED